MRLWGAASECARVCVCVTVLYTTTGLHSSIPLHLWVDRAELSYCTQAKGESSTCFMRPLEAAAQRAFHISTRPTLRLCGLIITESLLRQFSCTPWVNCETVTTISRLSEAPQTKKSAGGEGGRGGRGVKQWPHPEVGIFCIHTTTGGAHTCQGVMVIRQHDEFNKERGSQVSTDCSPLHDALST